MLISFLFFDYFYLSEGKPTSVKSSLRKKNNSFNGGQIPTTEKNLEKKNKNIYVPAR